MADEPQSAFGRDLPKAQTGDKSAAWRLVEGAGSYLRVHAGRLVGRNRKLARLTDRSELVQQAKLNGAQAIEDFRGANKWVFKGWLKSILYNEANRLLRRRRRELNRHRAEGWSNGIEAVDPALSPEQVAIRNEELAASNKEQEIEVLRRAVQELDENDRRLFDARIPPAGAKPVPFDDLAVQLNTSAAALRQRWTRLCKRLGQGVKLVATVRRPGFPEHYGDVLCRCHFHGWSTKDIAREFGGLPPQAAAELIERAEAARRKAEQTT